tara:strand:+ start:473 stop:790 length:318 start_codon:yes stop_codon:yes gene_type:complete
MPTDNNRAESVKSMFDTNGSRLAVPVSPNPNPTTDPSINIQGNSLLHNQYSNIGNPVITTSPYTNAGLAQAGYTPPNPSALGQRSEVYQGQTNRYSNNAPENRSF